MVLMGRMIRASAISRKAAIRMAMKLMNRLAIFVRKTISLEVSFSMEMSAQA